jgi:phytoene synthase
VRLHWPPKLRPAFDALFDIDDALAGVVARTTEPALGAIKLAWWRERLEELDQGKVPAEPRLQAAVAELLPRGIRGTELAVLEAGWAVWLEVPPDAARAIEGGVHLFKLGARLLNVDCENPAVAPAGRVFAAVQAARRAIADSGPQIASAVPKAIRPLRPLTALAALAARDARRGGPPFEPEATPARAATLLLHRLTGRI